MKIKLISMLALLPLVFSLSLRAEDNKEEPKEDESEEMDEGNSLSLDEASVDLFFIDTITSLIPIAQKVLPVVLPIAKSIFSSFLSEGHAPAAARKKTLDVVEKLASKLNEKPTAPVDAPVEKMEKEVAPK